MRSGSFGRGGWQERHAPRTAAAVGRVDSGSPVPLAAARRAGCASDSPRPRLPPPATGADQRSRATTDAAALPRGTGCSRHHPLPPSQPTPVTAYLVAGTPTSARTLRSPPVLPPHTFALPLARVLTLRGARLTFLPLSHQESGVILLPLSSSHPPPTPSSVCSNRTRGSPGCAHLIRGAGVASQGCAPSSAQRAARSALQRREHPALTIPNGFFQQRGA